MGIQLYEKKDDICCLPSLRPLQALPFTEKIKHKVIRVHAFFFCTLYFWKGMLLKQKPRKNGIMILYKIPLIISFSPRSFTFFHVSIV